MPFIGNQPALSYTSFAKQDFTTSATTSYSLDHPVANANELALFINFVRQEPTTAYTASGTSLTLTSATASSDDMYCVYLGKAIQTVNPPNASVGTSQLSSSLDLSSKTVTLANNMTNTPAFYAYLGSDQTGIGDDTAAKITIDTEVLDTDNCFASNKFTPTTAGKYFLYACINLDSGNFSQLRACEVYIYKNGSSILHSTNNLVENMGRKLSPYVSVVVDANGSSDYFELYGQLNTNGGGTWSATGYTSSQIRTYFGGYKLIGA